jgi:hypothetical protein
MAINMIYPDSCSAKCEYEFYSAIAECISFGHNYEPTQRPNEEELHDPLLRCRAYSQHT